MTDNIVHDILQSFKSGELDDLKVCILPFLKEHKNQLLEFIAKFEEKNGKQPLDSSIKCFILSYNMPFNMKFYMEGQSKIIEKDLGPELDSGGEKQKMVSTWISQKAANYRSHSILTQIICFDQMKKELLPQIRKELELDKSQMG